MDEKYLREENLVEQMKFLSKSFFTRQWTKNMLAEIDKEKEQAKKRNESFVQNLQTKKTEIESKTENLLDLFIDGKA